MKATHLTDEEIQQYVPDRELSDTAIARHIHSCAQCSEKAEAYRLLFAGLHEQPRESFDFPLTELVMQQLPLSVPTARMERENVLIYAFIIAGATIVGFALYSFRKYVAGIFDSIVPVFIYLVLTAFSTLCIFLVADLYKKHKKKIHTLDLYGS